MKSSILPCLLLFIHACGSAKSNIQTEEKQVQRKMDTCFYEINPAPDLDMPQTPHWDTTIVRKENCDVQCLKMRSWGTETQYGMSGPGGVSGGCHFFHESGSNLIDITGMPPGDYHFNLSACGNGGGFSVKIE